MKPVIAQFGTIDNTGDIQPDFLQFPGVSVLDPGIVPASEHPISHAGAGHWDQQDVPVVPNTDQSPIIMISAAGTEVSSSGTSDGAIVSEQSAADALVTYAPLVIVPEFGASIISLTGTGSDPTTAAEVEGAIDAAIAYYETHWTSSVPLGAVVDATTIDTVTLTIEFGYGTLDTTAMKPTSGASQSQYGLITIGNGSYATLYSTLSGELPDLPATDPTGGKGTFYVTDAQSQILGTGIAGATPAGWVGINSIKNGVTMDYNISDQSIAGEVGAVGAIEHEISEIMGRSSDLGLFRTNTYTLFDLYRFTAPNTPALTPGASDYFSLNNGTTALGYFNNHANGGDAGDWDLSGSHDVPADAYDAFLSTGTAGTISNLDSLVLGAIGLRVAPRTLLWTGAAGTSFSTPADWNDLTDGLDPAQTVPSGIDTTQFLTNGGAITGAATVASLQFGGTAQWNVTSGASLSAASSVTVGQRGSGTLLINGGASISGLGAADTITGAAGTGAASVTVDGAGSAWQSAGELIVGNLGVGSLTVSDGADLGAVATTLLPAAVLGAVAGGAGVLTVTGAGSRATLLGQIDVGQAGTGALTVQNQATVISGGSTLTPTQGVDVGQDAGATGSVAVSAALLNNTGQFIVGDAGVGSLVVDDGGAVVTTPGSVGGLAGLSIANAQSASGSSVSVSGGLSQLTVAGALDVGSHGAGALQISGGASVAADSLDAGTMAESVGQIGLSGSGTELSVSNAATVADAGTGVLSVLNGATFAAASLTVGAQGSGSGAVVVSGAGSVVRLSGALNVGTTLGIGELTVGTGAAVQASVVNLQGQAVLQGGLLDPTILTINQGVTAGGYGTIEAGDIVDEGIIQASFTPTQTLEVVRGTVLGGGTVTANGTVTSNAPGLLRINAGGTLELAGAVLNATTTSFADNLALARNYTVNNSVVDVGFTGTTGVLLLDDIANFAGTISAFNAGDRCVIAGATLTSLTVSNGNTLMLADSGAGAGGIDQLVFASAVSAAGFEIVNGDTVQMACFAAGTLIETGNGQVEVQTLGVGDEVKTLLGKPRPIVWVGSRSVDCSRHLQPETVWPVLIERGAFAENVPQRDLYISPDHAIYFDGVLIPVKLLVNCSTIRQIEMEHIVYHHVELEQHDVILAEGLAAETYLDVGDRHLFSSELVTVPYPELPARLWEMAGYAPLVQTGEALNSVRLALAERAKRPTAGTGAKPPRFDLPPGEDEPVAMQFH